MEKFGGNSTSVAGALSDNTGSAENLGFLIDKTIKDVFQHLIHNELINDNVGLEYFEGKGVGQLQLDTFDAAKPSVLHITNKKMEMDESVFAEEKKIIRQWICCPMPENKVCGAHTC